MRKFWNETRRDIVIIAIGTLSAFLVAEHNCRFAGVLTNSAVGGVRQDWCFPDRLAWDIWK
jgi:hypothetical protein